MTRHDMKCLDTTRQEIKGQQKAVHESTANFSFSDMLSNALAGQQQQQQMAPAPQSQRAGGGAAGASGSGSRSAGGGGKKKHRS